MPDAQFPNLKTPDGCVLRKKEVYEYVTTDNVYNVELFDNLDGTYYAIGVPREGERLIVYGSSIVESKEMALQILIDKIRREGALFANRGESAE